jgi:NAD(P)-dependent dehydrogenase (short-subunit alcohol dehydrogenase family)
MSLGIFGKTPERCAGHSSAVCRYLLLCASSALKLRCKKRAIFCLPPTALHSSIASRNKPIPIIATSRNGSCPDSVGQRCRSASSSDSSSVTDRDAVFAQVAAANQHFGRLDVLLHAAGYGLLGAVEEVAFAAARANIETNVLGTLSLIQAILPIMRAQGSGHILPVSSLGGVVAIPMFFQATKFAVEGIAEALAAEVAELGIHVTLIEPGAYNTSFFSDASLQKSKPLGAYDAVRVRLEEHADPATFGDPHATAEAIFAAVDADRPPLRLVLGSTALPLIRKTYAEKMNTWAEWESVSIKAQGRASSSA